MQALGRAGTADGGQERGVRGVLSHHHQADPGSGQRDQDASCSGAPEPGDQLEAAPGGRLV